MELTLCKWGFCDVLVIIIDSIMVQLPQAASQSGRPCVVLHCRSRPCGGNMRSGSALQSHGVLKVVASSAALQLFENVSPLRWGLMGSASQGSRKPQRPRGKQCMQVDFPSETDIPEHAYVCILCTYYEVECMCEYCLCVVCIMFTCIQQCRDPSIHCRLRHCADCPCTRNCGSRTHARPVSALPRWTLPLWAATAAPAAATACDAATYACISKQSVCMCACNNLCCMQVS